MCALASIYRSAGVERVLGYRTEDLPASWDAWAQLVYPGDWRATTDAEELAFLEALPGDTLETEYRIRHRDGHYLTVADHAALERDEAGHVIRLIGQTRDITERKRLENELAARASLLTAVFDAVPDRLTIFDASGEIVQLNTAAARLAEQELDRTTWETLGDVLQLRTPDGDPFPVQELPIVRALRGESVSGVEAQFRDATGRNQSSLTSAGPFYDRTGQLRGVVVVSHDVTALRTAERAAVERAAQLDATFDSLTDGSFLFDRSGQLIRMNEAARAILALDAAPDYYALTPDERTARMQVRDANNQPLAPEEWGLGSLAQGERLEELVELRITALDGNTKDLAITGGPVRDPDGTIMGAVALLRDVTDQRRLQRAVAEQASQLQATFDALAEPICVFDAQGRIVHQNRAEVDAFGFDTPPPTIEERAARIDLRDDEGHRIPPERHPARRVLAGATLVGIDTILLIARAADGDDRWYMVGGAPIRDDAGRIVGGVIIFRDVTERRLLGQQTRWQANMLERAHDAIFMWELDGPILYWNHGAELLYGYSSEEAVGQISHQLLHTERPVSPTEFMEALKRDGEWIGDIRQTTHDRRLLVVESRHQLVTEPDGRQYVLEVCRDITERLELERELRRSHDELERRVRDRTRELAKANRSLRRLSQQVLDVQERERRAIALELHEEIGQALTGAKLLLELVERSPGVEPTDGERIREARAVVNEALEQVRGLSLDLRPAVLDNLGLLPALRWLFERYTRQTAVQVRFSADEFEQRLPASIEINVYRLIQEALTNVSRHAGADAVTVQIRITAGTLTVYVVDSGTGFDVEEALSAGRSTGLAGMTERAGLLGGTVMISSIPGEGTTLEATIPLAPTTTVEEANEEE